MTDPARSLTDLAAALRSGTTTSVALVEESIARADEVDERLGVYIARFDDEARAAAVEADAALAAGRDLGPLHGIPIGVKDIVATREGPTTAQSRALPAEWSVPYVDSPVVGAAPRRRCGAHRQDHHDGVRHRLSRPGHAVPAAPQPVEPVDVDGRLVVGHRRGHRRRGVPGGHRLRHRRQHPAPGVLLRGDRLQADLRARAQGRGGAARVHLRPRRSAGGVGGRLRRRARRHRRPRRQRRLHRGRRAARPRRGVRSGHRRPPGRGRPARHRRQRLVRPGHRRRVRRRRDRAGEARRLGRRRRGAALQGAARRLLPRPLRRGLRLAPAPPRRALGPLRRQHPHVHRARRADLGRRPRPGRAGPPGRPPRRAPGCSTTST